MRYCVAMTHGKVAVKTSTNANNFCFNFAIFTKESKLCAHFVERACRARRFRVSFKLTELVRMFRVLSDDQHGHLA